MYETIPPRLQTERAWVNVWNGSKVPMQPMIPKAASPTHPETWGDFQTAAENVLCDIYDGIGYVFHDAGVVGIDIDAGKDEYGLLSPLARDIIGTCKSYTETSRSGRGFHVLLIGDLPFRGRNNGNGVEIYRDGRYFIMTGNSLIYHEMIENQAAIDYVVEKYFSDVIPTNDGTTGSFYEPTYLPPVDGKIRVRPYYPPIPEGSRHVSLLSVAGALHNRGYSPDQIRRELLTVNRTACESPVGEGEIENIVKSLKKWGR